MHIHPPVDPLFRVGEIGLGYDAESDLVVLVSRELCGGRTVTLKDASCGALLVHPRAGARHGTLGDEVASRGRPICPQCGEPMDPEGHFCPKKNGHKH